MKYCKICLQPDTRPNIVFNDEGICPACEHAGMMGSIDWRERRAELETIRDFGRANSSGGYDCIIGVSGGKDSTRQALFVKHVMQLNPLLVCCTFPPEQVSERGAANIQNLITLGFDLVTVGPGPGTWKHNMRHGFFRYGNWQRSTELALFTSVPRLAIAYQIPLILWGENPALTLGELGVRSRGYDGSNMRWGNTLAGGDPSWLIDDEVRPEMLLSYTYPPESDVERAGLRIVYLGYFWPIWSKRENGTIAALNGLDVRDEPAEDIGDILGVDCLDEDWVTVNQIFKFRKFGFARTTEIVNEEIRLGRMSRREGVELVRRYDGKCSDALVSDFCRYLEISERDFWSVADEYTNTDIFERGADGEWRLKFEIGAA